MAGVNQSLYTVIQGEEWNKYIYVQVGEERWRELV